MYSLQTTLSGLAICCALVACDQGSTGNPPEKPDAAVIRNAQILAFGTIIDFTASGVSQPAFEHAHRELSSLFARLHKDWHAWQAGDLYQFNQSLSRGERVPIPDSARPLIEAAIPLAVESEHLFNPAMGRLFRLWGFQDTDGTPWSPPDDQQIRALLRSNPRITDIHIEGDYARTDNPDVSLDFGAFAKGYGLELAAGHLESLGIRNAIINAGGDVKLLGSKDGEDWRIAIRSPDNQGPLASISLQGNQSVLTSGDYIRYHEATGKQYGHIIDPRDGYPADGVRSVTVIHANAGIADAAATALFVAGTEDWPAIAATMDIRYVLVVDNANNWYVTPDMKKVLEPIRQPASLQVVKPGKH